MVLDSEVLKSDMAGRMKALFRELEEEMDDDVTPEQRNDLMLDVFCKAISGSVVDHLLEHAVIEIARDIHDHGCECKVHWYNSNGQLRHTLSRGRDVDEYTHAHRAELK